MAPLLGDGVGAYGRPLIEGLEPRGAVGVPEQVPAPIAELAARMMGPTVPQPEPTDEVLTPVEVAKLLKADRRWVYKHAQELGL